MILVSVNGLALHIGSGGRGDARTGNLENQHVAAKLLCIRVVVCTPHSSLLAEMFL